MNRIIRIALFASSVLACSGPSAPPPGAGAATGPGPNDPGAVTPPGDPAAVPPDDGKPGAPCPARASATQGMHLMMSVTWAGTVGTNPGAGTVHVWTRSKLTYSGNAITGVNVACGSQLPDIEKTPIAGGGKVQAEFPPTVWDDASMPTFPATGTQSSFDVKSTITITPSPVLLGLTMADPAAAWPALGAVQATDSDGDGKLGITSVPKATGGYSQPPTSLLQTAHADKLYIASRTATSLAGVRDTCDSQKGTAVVSAFDNHVVGCHVAGGGECAKSDYEFIDQNRTVYVVKSATYEAKVVPDGATCADVRAALPAK
jgi:hypothetical protein